MNHASPLLVSKRNRARKMKIQAPMNSQRHATHNATTKQRVGIKCIISAKKISEIPTPSLNTSRANMLKNRINKTDNPLGLQ
nr:hypothetical protein [Desulfospira joergensenii]